MSQGTNAHRLKNRPSRRTFLQWATGVGIVGVAGCSGGGGDGTATTNGQSTTSVTGATEGTVTTQPSRDKFETNREDLPYEQVNGPTIINGKLTFKAIKGSEGATVIHGENQSQYYHSVDDHIVGVKGGVAFRCVTQDKKDFLNIAGEETKKYDLIVSQPRRTFRNVGGDIAFIAEEQSESFLIHGGEKRGTEYAEFDGLAEVDGKLAYIGKKEGEWTQYLVYEGNHTAKDKTISSLQGINGKLTYIERNQLVYGEEKLGTDYERVWEVTGMGGKPAYVVTNDLEREGVPDILVWGTEEIAQAPRIALPYPYDPTQWAMVGQTIAYKGKDQSGEFLRINDTKLRDVVGQVANVNGKLAYVGADGDGEYVVHGGSRGPSHTRIIGGPMERAGELVYMAYTDEEAGGMGENPIVVQRA